jgi:segregation and condensation protein A
MDGQQTLVMIAGKPLTEMPQDLFIPPDALEVLLDSFTGPLDLLLYLIRRQNIDIMDIPMRMITQQYMQYIELLEKRIELAADYLVMAAMLAEIKSRLLLPMEPTSDDQMEEDPRMALVKRLQLYEQFKQAALSLDELPRWERDIFPIQLACKIEVAKKALPDVALSALLEAMQEISRRQSHQVHHLIEREPLSVRERRLG